MIKVIITDFDGTLVDTYEANLKAYQDAFSKIGLNLTENDYKNSFGLRFDDFMNIMGIKDSKIKSSIRDNKMQVYHSYFNCLRVNKTLLNLIKKFIHQGGIAVIASTARRENLLNVLNYLKLSNLFEGIYTGEDVKEGKPSPEIYINIMKGLKVSPDEVLIFEDSLSGIQAANLSGAKYMIVTNNWFVD